MKFQGRRRMALFLCFAMLCINLFPITNQENQVIVTPMTEEVRAADVTMAPGEFYMLENSAKIENGKMITITDDSLTIGIGHTSGGIPSAAIIKWDPYDENVIELVWESNHSATVKAVGPGYSQLAAVISYGGIDYRVDCQIYVPLQIDSITKNVSDDINKLGMIGELKYGDGIDSRGLQLKGTFDGSDYTHYLVKLKYVSYLETVTNHTLVTTGSTIVASSPSIVWESSDESVATVDENGMVTAVGAGAATITVTTTTTYNGKRDSLTFPVLVSPLGRVSQTTGEKVKNLEFVASSSTFVIETNAQKSSSLVWTVHTSSDLDDTSAIINPEKSDLMDMTTSNYSGNVTFSNVKAGVYWITARPSDEFAENNSKVNKLIIKVTVPIFFGADKLTMNVGDYYDILKNSNIPAKDWFNFSTEDNNIASVSALGVILAEASGTTIIHLTKKVTNDLAVNKDITVEVVDGIGLNTNSATIFTGSTIQLVLTASNNAAPITWTSSKPEIATVNEDGLVTGLKVGNCVITVEQNINGITKRLTCKIMVKQSVTKITLDPIETDIAVGDFLTINATIEPKLNSVSLHWVSSDESVIKVTDPGALSATVQGITGGVAVVSAINQDNVVVGSCLIRVFQPIESITLSETNVTVPLSAKWFQLYATILPDYAKDQELVWSTTDKSIITVDSNGKVTLVKSGQASIIVTSKVNASISAICNVVVTKATTGIALDTTSRDMYVGETYRLTYVIKPTDASNAAVTWSSSNSSVATVDKTGLVSARAVGTAVIILKTSDGGYVATCTIKVSRTATAVKLDVTQLTMDVGDYYYLETTLTPADATETALAWESSDKKIATVSKSGKVIAKGAGTCIIMVKTKSGSTGYCSVKVLQPVTGITISSTEEYISVSDELELTAELLPSDAESQTIVWESSNEEVATVNDKGEVVGISGGIAIISCSTEDGNYKDFCYVTVEELITEITLNKTYYRLGLGRTYKLVATISGKNATNKQLEWFSSNESIVTVDENGKIKGVQVGSAIVTCMATDGSEAEASCTVRVCRLVTNIELDVSYITLVQGKSHALKATVSPSNATYKTPVYTSDNNDVALVNKSGVITAIKPGSCIITAKANDSSGVYAICYVNVIAPISSTGITISESEVVMSPGETKTVSISIVPNNSTDTYIWSSDNTVVATVNSKTGVITAKAMGTANITVMTESGRRGTIKVYVVGLSRTNVELAQYTRLKINLEVYGANTNDLRVRWDVDNQEVATVSNGLVTAKALGTTTVYAVVNGRRLSCKVTVVKIPSSK